MKLCHILCIAILSITSTMNAQVVHPQIGKKVQSADGRISIELVGKKQHFAPGDKSTADADINSPKSVNVHPNGKKFYVNSLEGATTVVYDMQRKHLFLWFTLFVGALLPAFLRHQCARPIGGSNH